MVTCTFNKLHRRLLRLYPVEFKQKQALSTHELYQLEGINAYLLESTFTRLSIENLVPEEHLVLYRNQSLAFVEAGFAEA